MPDPDVLTLAASMDCVLVSHDLETMPGHFYTFLESSNSPGAALLAQSVTTGHAIAEIQIAWHCLKADDFKNRIPYLP